MRSNFDSPGNVFQSNNCPSSSYRFDWKLSKKSYWDGQARACVPVTDWRRIRISVEWGDFRRRLGGNWVKARGSCWTHFRRPSFELSKARAFYSLASISLERSRRTMYTNYEGTKSDDRKKRYTWNVYKSAPIDLLNWLSKRERTTKEPHSFGTSS